MKKLIALSAAAAVVTLSYASGPATSSDDLRAELEQLKKEIAELKEAQSKINIKALKKQIREIKAHDAGDNIKWKADLRTAYDFISYKFATGDKKTNGIFTNRLWLGMEFAATDNLVFKGLLSYYKAYGQLPVPQQGFNYFDWIVNETPNPAGELRVKEAYWLYFGQNAFGADIPWTASFGRRPATDGLLANYREDQRPKSPLGHIINTEFDGASFKFNLENVTGISGMYFKLCMGRGMTNANTRYATNYPDANYVRVDGWDNTDLAGFIFVPYDDGQYSVHTTAFKAFSLPGYVVNQVTDLDGNPATQNDMSPSGFGFVQTGDLYGAAVSFLAQGIGDGISDMLDDTNAFISFAWSKTDPSKPYQVTVVNSTGTPLVTINKESMLGSSESKVGTSIYAGINWPCQLIENARVGLEFNHGSKYWRSFTYGEDTLAGSKLAARGNAYEVWFNKELIGKKLTAQVRYTYIDYKYAGSQSFFGDGGTPYTMDQVRMYNAMGMRIDAVDKAQDLRIYVRYRY